MESTDANDAVHSKPDLDSVGAIRDRLLESKLLHYVDLETAEEFAVAVSPFGPFLRNSVPPSPYLFRGVNRSEYDLVPSAFRAGCPYSQLCPRIHFGTEQIDDKQQIEFELDVLARFFRLADSQGLPLPEDSQEVREMLNSAMTQAEYLDAVVVERKPWPPPSLLSLMGLAQHHGLPTRLLDWSRNPFKAAYFAAREAAQGIMSGEADRTNRIALWAMATDMVDVMSALSKRKVDVPRPFPVKVITSPAATNRNLRAQEGVFSLYQTESCAEAYLVDRRPLEVQACEDIIRPEGHPIAVFRRFSLPGAEAGKLLWILASFGVSAASLFPDFQGASMAVREEALWERPKWDIR